MAKAEFKSMCIISGSAWLGFTSITHLYIDF
jgi:hypothetical protein